MKELIIAAVLVIVGAAGGAWLAARHYEPQLAEANRKAGENDQALKTCVAASTSQNAAIEALRDDAEKRRLRDIAAAKQAHGVAIDYFREGQIILGLRPPSGADPCKFARDAFDDELRDERGKR
jgi:hypothetical protein